MIATATSFEHNPKKPAPKKPPRPSIDNQRKACQYCKCPREDHDIQNEANETMDINTRINGIEFQVRGLKLDSSAANYYDDLPPPPPPQLENDFPPPPPPMNYREDFLDLNSIENEVSSLPPPPKVISGGFPKYLWTPSGLSQSQVELYMKELPPQKVPIKDSPGSKYYRAQMAYQLPVQDRDPEKLSTFSAAHRESFMQFNSSADNARGEGVVKVPFGRRQRCARCSHPILRSEPAVVAENIGAEASFHPGCFTCETCNELLVELTYFQHADKVYCGRHFAELQKSRCGGCDELIFTGEYTVAMNKNWHLGHFQCQTCDHSITGRQFIVRGDKPVCTDCFKDSYAHECEACHQKIGPESRDISSDDDRHWHDKCFICDICRRPLKSDGKFTFYRDQILCNNCYVANYQKECFACGQMIDSGASRLEYSGNFWHENCFRCANCGEAIGTSGFVPKDDTFFCPGCYQSKFSKRCASCGEPLLEGGVLYNGETWHKACFSCYFCHRSLASAAFSVRDGCRYCMECYGKFYAKQCEICLKAIVGGEYYTLEESNFHKECFMCSRCGRSLASEGFVREGDELLCGDCAD
ncbi:testin isoform X2 [Nematostella vectensis]|uniref:testin isoform X2 n=1 Tax=Nematostella vectensis TaxID=45351 RepID=UPI00207703C4|nr:testin isoform X2 [Nematostella vectensis]